MADDELTMVNLLGDTDVDMVIEYRSFAAAAGPFRRGAIMNRAGANIAASTPLTIADAYGILVDELPAASPGGHIALSGSFNRRAVHFSDNSPITDAHELTLKDKGIYLRPSTPI